MTKSLLCLLLLLPPALSVTTGSSLQPEQIHIAFGESTTEMSITWVTEDDTKGSVVQYGIDNFDGRARGQPKLFVDSGPMERGFYIHSVKLENLTPNTTYKYRVGSNFGWSAMYFFHTPPSGSDWSPSIAIFGDLGFLNAKSLPFLQLEAQDGLYDVAIHNGDICYQLEDENGVIGDYYMKEIEPIAAYVPYMVGPGNHEAVYNFSHYKARFTMPDSNDNMYYSFDIGPAHFVIFSTEIYIQTNLYDDLSVRLQFEWLEDDLTKANERREERPWIIVLGHEPMYCYPRNSFCADEMKSLRVGINTPKGLMYGLEDLFYKHGVDIEIWAHEHTYERLWPLYDYKVYNGSLEEPYRNYRAPVHFNSGSAGNKYMPEPPNDPMDVPWSAKFTRNYAYTKMKIHNKTHLYYEQFASDHLENIDEIWVIKDEHGPYVKHRENLA